MDDLHRLLKATFGHVSFRDGQEEVVRAVAAGEDTLVVMPTGAGKSLCYQLPALAIDGATLVVSPLIALMKDQVDSLQARGIAATCINSSVSPADRRDRIQGLIQGRWKLVYVAPERFTPRFLDQIRDASIGLLAIDEAHCVSEWGHDFRPDYLRLGSVRKQLGEPPTVALTATATPEVQRDIVRLVGIDGGRRFVRGFDRKNISLTVHECSGGPQKLSMLPELLQGGPALVYCATRKNVEKVVRSLRDAGIQAGMYHGGMEHQDRVQVQDAFMGGRVPVVVATNAFGMGVDKADIRCIVHYDIPGSVEAYYQEIGRAGRDGRPARAVLLFHPSDRRIQEFFVRSAHPEPEFVETIYQALHETWRQQGGEDPLVEAHRERLGALLPSEAGGHWAASACIRVLERQGWLRRVSARERDGSVELLTAPGAPPRGLVGRVYDLIHERLGAYPGESWMFQPSQLCRELQVDRAQLLGALRGLESRGIIRYQAPNQAGAVELVRPRQPLELDREALAHRRRFDLQKVERMVGYVHAACRRHYLLAYFGEKPSYQRCGSCDACRAGKLAAQNAESLDPQQLQAMRGVLACVQRLKGDYTPSMVARVLTGSSDRAVRALKLDRVVTYGLLSTWTVAEVEALIEALGHAGLLERSFVTRRIQGTERTYAVIGLTDAGQQQVLGRGTPPALDLPGAVVSALQRQAGKAPRASAGRGRRAAAPQPSGQVSDDLISYLSDVRRQLAQAADVPAYVVASNRTLRDIAARRPDSRQAMMGVHGMGPQRFQRFGQPLLDAVRAWGEGG
jgi:ATP-dependent DNA helicase RecQ